MFQKSARLQLLVLLLVLLGSAPAFAQSGRVVGQVTDQQGSILPGATVQIVSQDAAIKIEATTDNTGAYSFREIPSGNYQIVVHAEGFSVSTSRMLSVVANQELVNNVQLSVAAGTSEVVVSGGGANAAVETESPSLSTSISEEEVTGYGLNGRNFSQLMTLAPGVSSQTGQDEAKVGLAGSAKFSVNGGRVEYNTFEVDGSDVLNTSINASRGQGEPLMVYPSIDAIQEMKVLTSNYSAMYGKTASGSVLVTTKSGTGTFHGNVYEFLRNEAFNARNYFDQPGRTPLYRRQDIGGTLGGPFFIPGVYNTKKSKTFFFVSEEARLEKTPVDFNQAVPTAAERGGDFSDVCPVDTPGSSDPLNTSTNPDCPHTPDTGTGIHPSRTVIQNYTSKAILASGIIPEPNSVLGCNTTNPTPFARCYTASVSPPTFWREELFRIDQALTPQQQLAFRYIHDTWSTTTLTPQWGIVQNSFPTVENQLTGPGLDMVVSLAQALPHSILNRVALSYSVEHITLAPQPGPGLTSLERPAILDDPGSAKGWSPIVGNSHCGSTTGSKPTSGSAQMLDGCAMGYIFNNGFGGDKMPGLMFQGSNGAYGGHGFAADTGYAPWNQANPRYDLRDDASKTIGKHTLQFGFDSTLVQQNELSAVSGANSGDLQGLLTFSNQQSIYTSGNAFADFLAGPGLESLVVNPGNSGTSLEPGYDQTGIKSYTQDSGQSKYYNRYKMTELYLEDDYRINSRLVLNAGFRGSLFGTWYNAKGSAYNWRPESYDASLGASIYVDSTYGYLVRKTALGGATPGTPVPLNLEDLDPVITNGLTQCGASGVPSSCMAGHLFNPAPRMGFAWDPYGNGKVSIRAGYGLFWEHGTGYEANAGSLIGSAPLVLSETQSNIPTTAANINTGVGALNTIGFSCAGGTLQCGSFPSPKGGASFPLNVTSIPTKAVYSYTQQWSLSIERELHKSTVAQVAYVGTKGTHLTAVRDLNQLPPLGSSLNPFATGQPITASVCNSGATYDYFSTAGSNPAGGGNITSSAGIGPTSPGYVNMIVACSGNPGFYATGKNFNRVMGISPDAVRPYPGFSNIISVSNIADSEYHALQSTLRVTTGGLTVGAAYTYSHSVDDSSDRSSANLANSLDIRSNRASSDFDQRHLLNVSYVYELPLLKLLNGFVSMLGDTSDATEEPASGSALADTTPPGSKTSSILTALLGNWQLSGITTYQSGTPFSVVNGGGSNGTGPADNAGVGDGLGVGSYVDVIGSARGLKPTVASSSNLGPLLLNPGAFAAPRGLTFGNSGRNFLNNPSRTNFNMSLRKSFKTLNDRLNFEGRVEAYNVFNHTQFRIYDPSHAGNTGNNIVNCYGDISTGYSAAGGDGTDCLTGNSFLHPVDAHDPRILQLGIKMAF